MLAISPTLAAAAYLLLGQPGNTGQPAPIIVPPLCQFPGVAARTCPPGRDCDVNGRPISGHLTVRWVGSHHPRHCYRWRHGWRCRAVAWGEK